MAASNYVALTAVVSLFLVGSCGKEPRRVARIGPAERARTQVDTVLADSGGVFVRLSQDTDRTTLRIGVRRCPAVRLVYRSGDLVNAMPAVRLLNIGRDLPAVFWSVDLENLRGAALVKVSTDTAVTLYHATVPERGVCDRPTAETVDGAIVIVERKSAVFPSELCLSADQNCPFEFPSTWPTLLAVRGDTVVDVSKEHPHYYASFADTLAAWATRLQQGATSRYGGGESKRTILEECGRSVLDSIGRLRTRAEAIAGRSE